MKSYEQVNGSTIIIYMYCNQAKTHDVNLGYLLVGMDVTQMFVAIFV